MHHDLPADPAATPRFGVIVLAAGASRRMGQPKLLMRWGRQSVIGHVTRSFREAGAHFIAAVHAPTHPALRLELEQIGVKPILNPDAPAADMFSSIRCGIAWTGWPPTLSHFVIALGDMPAIAPSTLRGLLTFAAVHPERICQPRQGERMGHPIILPRLYARAVHDGAHPHLRAALAHHSVLGFPTEDAGIHADIDTPEAFHALKRSSRP